MAGKMSREIDEKKVLFFLPRFESGGAEAFVVNIIEELSENGVSSQVLSIDGSSSIYDLRLSSIGVKREVLVEERYSNPFFLYLRAYREFNKYLKRHEGEYFAVHLNLAQGEELPFARICRKHGIGRRIVHSHNSSVNNRLKHLGHLICKGMYRNEATTYCACSEVAANWLFPKKLVQNNDYILIKNGIKTESFRFSLNARMRKRFELGIDNEKVILNIGRLCHQKNQSYLLREFAKSLSENPNMLLLIVGEGDLEEELKTRAAQLNLRDRIMWLGGRTDISELMAASDMFVLPSLFEGFPFTLVEAQASGLPCIVSNQVSKECKLIDPLVYVPIEAGCFANEILNTKLSTFSQRELCADAVRSAKYDIEDTIAELKLEYGI